METVLNPSENKVKWMNELMLFAAQTLIIHDIPKLLALQVASVMICDTTTAASLVIYFQRSRTGLSRARFVAVVRAVGRSSNIVSFMYPEPTLS